MQLFREGGLLVPLSGERWVRLRSYVAPAPCLDRLSYPDEQLLAEWIRHPLYEDALLGVEESVYIAFVQGRGYHGPFVRDRLRPHHYRRLREEVFWEEISGELEGQGSSKELAAFWERLEEVFRASTRLFRLELTEWSRAYGDESMRWWRYYREYVLVEEGGDRDGDGFYRHRLHWLAVLEGLGVGSRDVGLLSKLLACTGRRGKLGLRYVGDKFVPLQEDTWALLRSHEAVGAREELPSDVEFLDALIHHPLYHDLLIGEMPESKSERTRLFVSGEQWWGYHGLFSFNKIRPDWYEWVSRDRFWEEAERLIRRRSLGGEEFEEFWGRLEEIVQASTRIFRLKYTEKDFEYFHEAPIHDYYREYVLLEEGRDRDADGFYRHRVHFLVVGGE
ncbi:hypothetical protein [Rhodothermus profundi]|uniref:Uncharacterized protein n=1 Tax=Rhodothermus profundi TaxID=633813 RepID=A0A1M6XV84_9BACT|nr:hypothetical protein [Rhodothermus profundi]SHL09778.1 hypothetical protein SAMN04488087_2712 [Rhodothermus profundi]